MRIRWVHRLGLLAIILFVIPVAYADETPADVYDRAVTLFNAQDYNSALPLLTLAIQSDPSNYMAYYYLGTCQGKTGDLKFQALNYYLSDRLHPYPELKSYADKIKNSLPIEDQDWMDRRLATAPATPSPTSTPAPIESTVSVSDTGFGVRLSTALSFFTLGDFNTELGFVNWEVQGWEAANPSGGYQLKTTLSSSGVGFEINPFFPVGKNLEAGFFFTYWPSAGASYEITASAAPSYFVNNQWSLSSFSLGFKGRGYVGEPVVNGFRFFVEPALGGQPIYIHENRTYQNTASTPASNQVGYDVSAMAIQGALKMGGAWIPALHAQVSLTAGWQFAAATGFNGTYSDSGVPTMNGAAGSVQMYTSPSTGQSYMTFIPSDPAQYTNFGVNSSTQKYCRGLTVDLGGFVLNLDASYSF